MEYDMGRHEFSELTAFMAVAEHRSFTKAAGDLGISTSTLSGTIKALEERLGVRLLNRTTRSVAPTQAGDQLLEQLGPALESVGVALDSLDIFRETSRGRLRLNVGRVAAMTVIAPLFARFVEEHPDIHLEVAVDDSRRDIVSGHFDAGIRFGELVDQDMIAVRISDKLKLVTVAAPAYLQRRGHPEMPKDLLGHSCIRVRLPWDGAIHKWQFNNGGQRHEVAVAGPLTVNDADLAVRAAVDGVGIAYLPEDCVVPQLNAGRLVRLLEDWSPSLSGFFLYYPSRRQVPPPLKAFVDFVKQSHMPHRRAAHARRAAPPLAASA
jgi:DNA-binding transcriptional LysR family regulator